ncbi:neural cell adhesion molecule 1 isoform X1 [Osmerus mordax]|uniref:neural cell adhesion molecule 1 isoform X1 n=1 Tax=Osmerus mordax TaxID=8014 RepID=UPI00350F067B
MAQSVLLLRLGMLILALGLTEAKVEIITSTADVKLGEDHMFLCKTNVEGEITWYKDGMDVDEEVEKVDETSSKFFIRKAKMGDSGLYTCECTPDSGPKSSTSLTVFVYERPSFGTTPLFHEFLEGQDAVVPCIVTGQPKVEVRWIRDDEVVGRDGMRVSVMSDNSLQIKSIKRTDGGSYTCEGSFRGRQSISEKRVISITINAPPTVRIHEEVKRVVAGPETNVSLICLVEGLPKPNISWTLPDTFDTTRHQFNSDRSELTLYSVVRKDYGEYVCTAKNKISENSAMIMLDVSEHPVVVLSQEEVEVNPGEDVFVSCNVSGHPTPSLLWISNTGHPLNSSEGRVRVENGSQLVVEKVVPSNGGVYNCMAISPSGNISKEFSLRTHPGPPSQVSAYPGPTSVIFSLGRTQVDGGSPITHYTIQWRKSAQDTWSETTVPAIDPVAITSLKPYTSYSVRLSPSNHLGEGDFSTQQTVRTQGIRGEPDSPVLLAHEGKGEGNSFSVPLRQLDDGGSPITQYILRYRMVKEGEEWTERKLPSNSTALHLQDLQYNSDFHLELQAANLNGYSSPAKLDFSTPKAVSKARNGVGKAGIVGIVLFIFLVLLLAVDATCCYTNRCGLLMFLAVRLFGQKVSGLKTLEEGDGTNNGDLKLNGLETPRGSVSKQQTVNGNQVRAEVTCDKAPLTKFEKTPSSGDPVIDT